MKPLKLLVISKTEIKLPWKILNAHVDKHKNRALCNNYNNIKNVYTALEIIINSDFQSRVVHSKKVFWVANKIRRGRVF